MAEKMNVEEIEQKVNEILEEFPHTYESRGEVKSYTTTFHDFLSGEFDNDKCERLKLISQEGGGEGEGEHVEAIFMLDGEYYKATWSYFSHYGYDWDYLEVNKVVPTERTITVYE